MLAEKVHHALAGVWIKQEPGVFAVVDPVDLGMGRAAIEDKWVISSAESLARVINVDAAIALAHVAEGGLGGKVAAAVRIGTDGGSAIRRGGIARAVNE